MSQRPSTMPPTKTVLGKHSLDDGGSSLARTKKFKSSDSPRKISAEADAMLTAIPRMRNTVEEIYSGKVNDSRVVLMKWRHACTKGRDQDNNWTNSERELLSARLPEDAYLSDVYNKMYEDFCRKPQDGVNEAERVLKSIPKMEQGITDIYNAEKAKCMLILTKWEDLCEEVRAGTLQVPPLNEFLPTSGLESRLFYKYNARYQSFAELVKLHVNNLLPPSEFGKEGQWAYEQEKEARIYCLRPPDVRSLPLCILHDIFRQFLLDIERHLPPASDTVIMAQRIGAQLCATMGMSVSRKIQSTTAPRSRDDKENKRTQEFDTCISDFLGNVKPAYSLNPASDAHNGIVDGVILKDGIFIALREMKAEPGASGDAYIQIARCYDLAVKVLLEDPSAEAFVRQGAPMFLLCIVGPMIKVSGGFYDGRRTIVEPLTAFCDMLEDPLNKRQDQVARILYALRKGIDKLEGLIQNNQSLPLFPPATPRIYSSCTLYDRHNLPNSATPSGSHQEQLEFEGNQRLEFHQIAMSRLLLEHNSLLFIGTLPGAGPLFPSQVFVKLARRCGERVHQLLEAENLAPKLYAKSEVEGAPTAFIMEYLEPSSWQTLHHYTNEYLKTPSRDSNSMELVRFSINKVLTILRENKVVHGDLRSANIMVQVLPLTSMLVCVDDEGSQRASIRVIDFDWSGEAGEVHYPPTRNEQIHGITWPGKPGSPIKQDDDKQLFESWWPNLGQ